jgi:hypothetical protein
VLEHAKQRVEAALIQGRETRSRSTTSRTRSRSWVAQDDVDVAVEETLERFLQIPEAAVRRARQ